MFNLTKIINSVCYQVYHDNGVFCGDFVMGDDGYYAWWPYRRDGYWSQAALQELSDKLKELNAEWDKIVQEDQNI